MTSMIFLGSGVNVTHLLVPRAGMGGQVPGGSNARAGSRPHRHSVAGQSPWSTHNGRGHGAVMHSVDKGKHRQALRGSSYVHLQSDLAFSMAGSSCTGLPRFTGAPGPLHRSAAR